MKILQNLTLVLFFPLFIAIYTIAVLLRLVCALIYNSTDFIMFIASDCRRDFRETKDTVDKLAEIPSMIYDVLIFLKNN